MSAQSTRRPLSAAARAAIPTANSVAAASSVRVGVAEDVSCKPPSARPPPVNRVSIASMPKGRTAPSPPSTVFMAPRRRASVSMGGAVEDIIAATHLFAICSVDSAGGSRRCGSGSIIGTGQGRWQMRAGNGVPKKAGQGPITIISGGVCARWRSVPCTSERCVSAVRNAVTSAFWTPLRSGGCFTGEDGTARWGWWGGGYAARHARRRDTPSVPMW